MHYGIDIGKKKIVIAKAEDNKKPAEWKTEEIEITKLKQIRIEPPAIVAVEPTGYWYSRPVIQYLKQANVTVLLVSHKTTAYHRAEFARAKTDAMDARALALIAQKSSTEPQRGTRVSNDEKEEVLEKLRMLINSNMRHKRTSVKTINTMGTLVHALYPGITPQRIMTHGTADPKELEQIATSARHGSTRNSARAILDARAVETPADQAVAQEIKELIEEEKRTEKRIEEAEKKIAEIITEHYKELTEAWRTIPAVGDTLIAALIIATRGVIEDISSFKATIGVQPITNESGERKTSKPNRAGYKPARVLLHMWTMRAVKEGKPREIAEYAKRKGLSPAKRKAAHLFYGVAKNPPWQESEKA